MLLPNLTRLVSVPACILIASSLTACEKQTIDVNLHGVNYSDNIFSYYVVDPSDPEKTTGGERVDRFSGGGITCCATLSRKWQPGLKLRIKTTYWLARKADGSFPEIDEVHVVDVPPYVDDKAGELWVLREADGKISIVSSDYEPDHPKWPGKIKGWPVPSQEYMLEKWEQLKKYEEDGVDLYLSLLSELNKAPQKRAQEAWEYAMHDAPESLKRFAGPEDPRYAEALREEYTAGLKSARERLKSVMEMKP